MPWMLEWPSNFSRILGPLCKGTIVALNSTFPLCLQYLNITHKQIFFSRTAQPSSMLASTLNSLQPRVIWVSLSWGSCLDQIGLWVWLCALSWLIGVVDVGGPSGWHQPQAFHVLDLIRKVTEIEPRREPGSSIPPRFLPCGSSCPDVSQGWAVICNMKWILSLLSYFESWCFS